MDDNPLEPNKCPVEALGASNSNNRSSRGALNDSIAQPRHSGYSYEPNSCSSSPFEDTEALAATKTVPQENVGRESEQIEEKSSFKPDSPPLESKPQALSSDRILEKPPVPRIRLKAEEESERDTGKLSISRAKEELVPEEMELLDELVQAINCDDFKRVMFIQNVVKEKNGEQWDVLFRNLPKNCQCVLRDYEKSLSKEDIRAIRTEVERELDATEEQIDLPTETRRRHFSSNSPELDLRSNGTGVRTRYHQPRVSPSRPEPSVAEIYLRSRRSASPDFRSNGSPARRGSPEGLQSFLDQELARFKAEPGDSMSLARDCDFWKQKSRSLELQLRRMNCELESLNEKVQRTRHEADGWPRRVAELEASNAELQRELEGRRRQDRILADRARDLEARLSCVLQQHEVTRERPRFDETFVRRVLADYDAQGRELDQQRRLLAEKENLLDKALSENEGLQRRLDVMGKSLDRLHEEKEAAILRNFNRVAYESDDRSRLIHSSKHSDLATNQRSPLPLKRHGSLNNAPYRTSSAPLPSSLDAQEELRQLEKRYDHLQGEKKRLEIELSHLPCSRPLRNRRQLQSEEDRIENRLDQVTMELGSLRLTLKQRGVL